ncbi:MAG: hypothetical protein K0S33_720 [Bacteroidetes bacterium]|nr:hypothetical protein [Bacteroidota bacterium]
MKKPDLYSFLQFKSLTFLLCCLGMIANAQTEKGLLRSGNSKYSKGKYADAEKNYLNSLKEKQGYLKAEYNLGNAYYKQGKFSEASQQYENVVRGTNNKDTLTTVFHNLGNSYLKQKNYEGAISAYKNSLKINSKDDSTRYNLAYALRKLQEQQKKEQQNKDKQDQKEEDKKEEKKGGDNKKDQGQQQPQQGQMSKEEAQRMLDALKNNEKKIAGKRKIKGDKNDRTNPEKDW